MVPINPNLLWMIAGTFVALSIGSAVRWFALRNAAADIVKKRMGSLKVWWILVTLWSAAVLIGQIGTAVLLAVASFLAMREYLRLVGTAARIGFAAIGCLFLCGIVHYALILSGASQMAKWFLPIFGLMALGACRSTLSGTQDYIRITAGVYWGAILIVYGLSHSLFLFEIQSNSAPWVGVAGWFLFLVLLTEMNDIVQAIVGRKLGRRKITPRVSPNKSLEGLIGGVIFTIALSILLAPWLTALTAGRTWWEGILISVSAGLLISLSGFLGDINMSAIKRDAGVKDGSSLLPGMGGVIDRIDSMTFTGPVFYYFVVLVNQTQVQAEGIM
jgi:phosphatidate cytidylyltransferase